MIRRRAPMIAWLIVVVSLALATTGVVVGAVGAGGTAGDFAFISVGIVLLLVVSIVGGLVASRQPRNPIGWILCAFIAFEGISTLAAGYAEVAPADATRGAGQGAAWFANWAYVSFFALVIFVLLYFPDGRLLSRRWRLAAWCGALGVVMFAGGSAFQPGRLHDYPKVANPVAVNRTFAEVLGLAGMALTICALCAGAVAIVVRYRRSGGLARLQIKWLALAAVFAVVAVAVGGTMGGLGLENAGNAIILVGVLGVPVAIGIALLRYRLYDIDRVISRTLVYGSLTVVLGAGYAGLVLAGQTLFSSFAGGSNLAIAVSTLVVAALFLPLRGRVQVLVDRRFNRRRYDAQRTLEAFGARLREQVDLETLTTELVATVRDTLQPRHVSLWLRRGAGAL